MPGDIITFDASGSYASSGTIVSYTWDFGDGTVATVTSPTITHSYLIDGTYTVQLTVTDSNGAQDATVAVVDVSTLVFFRVVFSGTLIPISGATVTAYVNFGSGWVTAPVGPSDSEIQYDSMTQPNLATTSAQENQNPGLTASILDQDASNIGFDVYPSCWTVYFKFQWGPWTAYWPNDTTSVYSYNNGTVETHNYGYDDGAYWDPTASSYVISVGNIPQNGVSPSECHPIIVGIPCPPPPQQYFLTVNTSPSGITTIPGQGWYNQGTNVTLTAPTYVTASSNTRYRFNYWGVDGTSQGAGVNPITITMNANHTATAHYVTQYSVVFNQAGLSADANGTIVTVNGTAENYTQMPFTLWVDSGGSVNYSYSSIVSSSVSGKQFRLSSVTGPSSPITVSGPCLTVTGNYVKQYQVTFAQTGLDSSASGTVVTVNGTAEVYANLPYTLWVNSGSSVTYAYSSTVSSSTAGKQFILKSVDCVCSPIIVTGPVTVTGNYAVQYLITVTQTGLDSTAEGTIVTVNGTPKIFSQLPYTLWVNSGSSVTYAYSSTVSSSVSAEQFILSSVTGPSSSFTVSGPVTVTGNYVKQYQVTFAQAGLDSSATGTVVTVNGTAEVYASLPYTLWVNSGSSVTYSYSSTVSSSTTGKQFMLLSVTGSSSPITVSGPVTVTGNYVKQYQVTFAQAGLDSSATGTVVTVNGTAEVYASLPYTLWVNSGSSVTYSYSSTVSSSTTGKQFMLLSVTGSSSPITVSGPVTVTGNYETQYYLTVTSAYDSPTPPSGWFDAGINITEAVTSPKSGGSGTQYVCTGWSGSGSVPGSGSASSVTFTITQASSITWNWKTQFQVTFGESGVGSDFAGTVVTVDNVNYSLSGLPVYFWWDSGSGHNFSFASPLIVNATKQYGWNSTLGLSALQSGTLTVTASGSVIGNYIVQNQVTFDQVGVGSDFTGTVVIIDSVSYSKAQLPISFSWSVGSSHNFTFQSPLVVGTNAEQYVWTSTTGLSASQSTTITVTTYGSIIGNYETQYYLTVASLYGSPSPSSGWFDSGTGITEFVTSPVSGGSGTQYVCTGWTGSGSVPASGAVSSVTFTITQASSITWSWETQYQVTFSQTGVGLDFSGTVVTVDGFNYSVAGLPVSFWWDNGTLLGFSFYSPLVVTADGKQYAWTSTTGLSNSQAEFITVTTSGNVVGNYETQYYLTVASLYGSPSPSSGWFDSGTGITEFVTSPVSGGSGTQYVCTGWTGSGSVPASGAVSSVTFTITQASSITWSWETQYQVTFSQTGVGLDFSGTVVTVDGFNYSVAGLPVSFWWDSGSGHTFAYSSPLVVTADSKQYVWTSTSGQSTLQSGSLTVSSSGSVTGNYKTQYYLTVTSPYDSPTPQSGWFDSGTEVTESVTSPVFGPSGTQYVCTGWSGSGSVPASGGTSSVTFTITQASSITWSWETQYQVTFSQTGVGLDFSGTVVTVDNVNYGVSGLPVSFWYDSGSMHSFAYASPLTVNASSQYAWSSTSGLSGLQSGNLTITASGSVVGNYIAQNKVTFDQVGVGSDFTGTVVIIDGSPYALSSLPASFSWSIGSNHTFAFQSPLVVSANSKQYVWTSTSGLSTLQSGSITVTTYGSIIGNYKTQYYMTVASLYDSPTPASGWFDSGTGITESITSPAAGPSGTQYVCTGWSGSGSVPASGGTSSVTFTITQASSITWSWETQYYLTVTSPYDSPTPQSGWFDSGTGITESVTSPTSGPPGIQYACTGWNGSGSVPASGSVSSVTFTISAPSNITWNWKTQYYLAVTSPYNSPTPPSGWFDSGTIITDSVTSPTAGPSDTQYVCTGWTGSGSVPASGSTPSETFTISAPSNVTWNWETQYQITFSQTGVGLDFSGTVVTIDSVNYGVSGLPVSFWWNSSSMHTFAYASPLIVNASKQYSWSSTSGLSGLQNGTLTVTASGTVAGNYIIQNQVTFDQVGVGSDFTGTLLIVDGTPYNVTDLPVSFTWNIGDVHTFAFQSPLVVAANSEQYVWTGTSGLSTVQGGSLTVTTYGSIIGNYKTQYYLTVTSPQGTTGGQGWYDSGTIAYAALDTGLVDYGNGTRDVFTNWSGDASGTNYTQSNAIVMNGPKTAVANWITQYAVTFGQVGLDSSASSTVVTVNSNPITLVQLPCAIWADSGSSVTYTYSNVSSSNPGEQFVLIGVTGLTSPITVTAPTTITGNYQTQYQVTFSQTGVGSDFAGTVVVIDGNYYGVANLPVSFWLDNSSSHTFSFSSPLVVNASEQYNWVSSSGLTTLQNGSILVTGSGSVTGNYSMETKYQITFSQNGVGPDFNGTVVTIDGTSYTVVDLPVSFWWDPSSIHTFAYQSPLVVTQNGEQYIWTSTSGLSTMQSDNITVTASGSMTGSYITQYYLTLVTSPSGVNSPSGAGWYEANTNATISTAGFVDIVPGSSRYRFNGWTTPNMTEIADPTRSPTNVTMDEAKTVTANYVAQYVVVFNQSGIGSDFTGTVVAIDNINYNVTTLPATFFWDNGTTHSFDFESPLIVTSNAESYVWASTTGLSTQQSDFIVVMSYGNITGNYEAQYYLTVAVSPPGIATIPGQGWYNESASVMLTAPSVSNYTFAYWLVNGASQGAGVNLITLTMNAPQNATAEYTPVTPCTFTITTTSGGTTNPPPGTYTYSSGTTVQVTALPNSGYIFNQWVLNSTGVTSTINPILVTLNMNHTLEAFFSPAPPPLTVTISPMDSTVDVGESVFFTSSVSGGTAPYSYQWFLNGAPVSGANSTSWTFVPTSEGMDFVYLKVTDINNNTASSGYAEVTVITPPVGGYSVSLAKHETFVQTASYMTLMGLFAAAVIVFKRKRK
jgi:hypothetical protein